MEWLQEELEASYRKGYERGWGISTTYDVRDGWVYVGFANRRIYAPLEHPELPSQFAAVIGMPRKLQAFLETYGHLGFVNLPHSRERGRPPDDSVEAVRGEPLDWIDTHARTVGWCLQAAEALNSAAATTNRFKRLWQAFPDTYAVLGTTYERESARVPDLMARSGLLELWEPEPLGGKRPAQRHLVGWLVAAVLTANLCDVDRRVRWITPPGLRARFVTQWPVNSLVEAIYMLVANAVSESTLAICEACEAPFIQTDARQRYCPRSMSQQRSLCAVRTAVRKCRARKRTAHRARPKSKPRAPRARTR